MDASFSMAPPSSSAQTTVLIVTAMGGAGKTVSLRALEDSNFYTIDHLPAEVLRSTLEALIAKGIHRIAIGLDLDAALQTDVESLTNWYDQWCISINQIGHLRWLSLHATSDSILRRYRESRRPHPKEHTGLSIVQAIEQEHQQLRLLTRHWHRLDTSTMNNAKLQEWVCESMTQRSYELCIAIQSFGFKHGVPMDTDLMFDVRCLPNPHYDLALRPLNGTNTEIQEFFAQHPCVDDMGRDILAFILKWKLTYASDQRRRLNVAIGCTGGKHRSVYLTEWLASHLQQQDHAVHYRHRDQKYW